MNPKLVLAYFLSFIGASLISYTAVPWLTNKWFLRQEARAEIIASKLENMFVFIKEKRLTIFLGIFPVVLGFILFIFWKWIGLGIGIVLGIIFPLFFLRMIIVRRRAKFVKQLIDGLMVLSSCLKGGLSLVQSFEVLVEEMSPPISQEFGLVVREIKVGVSIEEALERLNKRMPSEELSLFISAILVARETGGDLTKVFSRLVTTLRDRAEVKEEVITLTTQAKIQAVIMSLLPIGFIWWVYKVNPHHFDIMFQTELGRILIVLGGVLYLIAVVLLKKFSKVNI